MKDVSHEKTNTVLISLHEVLRVAKIVKTEGSGMVVSGGRSEETAERLFDGIGVAVLGSEGFWRWTEVMAAQESECTEHH